MTKRYLGNIITQNPTAPANDYETTSAPGVWSLGEAFAYAKAGLWPTAGNAAPNAIHTYDGSGIIDGYNISTLGNAVEFADEARFDDDFVTYGFSPSRVLYWMGMTPKAEDDKSLIRDI